MTSRFCSTRSGFTLIEILVTTFVSLLLVTSLLATVTQLRSTMRAQQLIGEMHQNTRFAMDSVSRDIRMAGYGLNVPQPYLDDWVSWIPGFDENPLIVGDTSGGPDELIVVAAFDDPVAQLAIPASKGDTTITVIPLGGFDLADFSNYDSSVIFIGKSTTARITAAAGTQLGVSVHHDRSMGLKHDYPAGTPVELVRTVRYERHDGSSYPDYPYLARTDSSSTYTDDWMNMVAGHIENFQLRKIGNAWEVRLAGIVAHPDRFYTHPVQGDHYRRETLTSVIDTRN